MSDFHMLLNNVSDTGKLMAGNENEFSMPYLLLKDLFFNIGRINLWPQLLSELKTDVSCNL